jgi:hypothetical protein
LWCAIPSELEENNKRTIDALLQPLEAINSYRSIKNRSLYN